MKKIFFLFVMTSLMMGFAQNLKLPEPLKEWKDWVLYDVKDLDCPIYYNSNKKLSKQCIWYQNMEYNPENNSVTLKVWNFSKDNILIPLITADSGWINSLVLGKTNVPISEKNNTPYVSVPRGKHKIEFKIVSNKPINYLKLPEGLLGLKIKGKGFLSKDKTQKVWLKAQELNSGRKDSFDVSIYRKILDGHPMKMETYLHFRVSGKMRYITLKGTLVEGFLPTSIRGTLKASIEKNGDLKVELKSGEWDIFISSFANKNITKVKPPNYNFKPSNDEVWVFKDNPSYRNVKIEGVSPVDPTQTTMPKSWRKFPAYLVSKNSTFKIVEIYKSVDGKNANRFDMIRDVWLDFSGEGYSLFDTISTNLNMPTRLESEDLFKLMSLSIDGTPQVLSSVSANGNVGVELRKKKSEITTSARYESNISELPVNGWNQKLDRATLNLNLPPAWRILASTGSDEHSELWIDEWNLLDIFLLILLMILIYKLYNIQTAIVVAILGIIFWQEPNAPTIIWIFTAFFIALLRVLPAGKLRKFLMLLTVATLTKLIFVVFNFGIFELRASLYPQLEKYDSDMSLISAISGTSLKVKNMSNIYYDMKSPMPMKGRVKYMNHINIDEKAQTGFAKPLWSWNKYSFFWKGGIGTQDKLKVLLVPPVVTRVWRVISFLGVLFLLFIFVKDFIYEYQREPYYDDNDNDEVEEESPHLKNFIMILLIVFVSFSDTVYSKSTKQKQIKQLKQMIIPNQTILNELKVRLINEKEVCKSGSGSCASIEKVTVNAFNNKLKINMKVSAQTRLYIPTLERIGGWVAESIKVDSNSSGLRFVDANGDLYLYIPKGNHKIAIEGSLKGFDRLSLESKVPMRVINSRSSKEYKINIGNDHFIEILRVLNQKDKQLNSSIAPFISISRVFHLQNSWYITTTISLVNSDNLQNPSILEYPLLPNESVLNQDIETKDRKAIITLSKNQQVVTFRSSIPISENLTLKAYKSNEELISEEWLIDVNPVWHIEFKGLESIGNVVVNGKLLPKFKPWENESLELNVSRTIPQKGVNLTIESSKLIINQSNSYRDLKLKLKIKSATTLYYPVVIENLQELKSVKIDNREYFLKPNGDNLNIPLKIGSQNIEIQWREKNSTANIYQFPTIQLDRNSSNATVELNLLNGDSRWIVYTGGAPLGPVVLIWGVMVAVLIFAFIITKLLDTPPTLLEWSILFLGITTVYPWIILPIVIWIVLIKFKIYKADELDGKALNYTQIALVLSTIVTIFAILFSIVNSLMGRPDMMIEGNGSNYHHLVWYYDFIGKELFKPKLISLSEFYYRAIMLIWSLWASFTLINWTIRAWRAFSQGKIWDRSVKVNEEKR